MPGGAPVSGSAGASGYECGTRACCAVYCACQAVQDYVSVELITVVVFEQSCRRGGMVVRRAVVLHDAATWP